MKKLFFLCACFLLVSPCTADIITVDDDGPADYNNIQAAIDDSNDGDIIEVQPGTYTGFGNRDINFKGKAITVRSTDPNDPNIVTATVIDCNGICDPLSPEYHRGFYFHNNETIDSVIAGLTIINGCAPCGGAVYCFDSSPTVTRCVIAENVAADLSVFPLLALGGGIYCDESSPTISNCTISGNAARDSGGGMYNNWSSSPTLSNCRFTRNSAGSSGGGMGNYPHSNPTVTNCAFIGNTAETWYGGGMYNWHHSSPKVTNCTFTKNSAGASGGGIYSWHLCSPALTNCAFSGNMAGEHGGGMASRWSDVNLVNCTFSRNSADEYGGGMDSELSDANLVNCSFSGNSAPQGSALACDSYEQRLPSNLKLANCILWDGGNEVWNNDGSTIIITYSDVSGGWPGEGNIDIDPEFAFDTDCHLMPGSPCIDAGTNTPIHGLPETDMDGNPRILDGNEDGNTITDIGAYEYNPQAPSIALTPRAFQFVGMEGGSHTPSQTLYLRNCGRNTLNWAIEGPPWLEAQPETGTSAGEVIEVAIWANPNGLSRGHYYGNLTINDPHAVNSPQKVEVAIQVVRRLFVPEEYSTIQAAINDALDGDIVVVSPRTYTGPGNRDIDFLGKAITVRSIDPSDPNIVAATIIDCNGSKEDPHRGFYFHTNEDANSIVDGLTIMNGYAPLEPSPFPWEPPFALPGGGICCEVSSFPQPPSGPTIRNCVIIGNSSHPGAPGSAGGGVYGCNGPIVNCTITGNSAALGGGLCGCDGPITDCTITNNKWEGLSSCNGPVTNCILSGNKGPALRWCDGPITNCVITGNFAMWPGVLGYCVGPITNCIIWDNHVADLVLRDCSVPLYSCIQGGSGGTGCIAADPHFASPGYWADANDPNIVVEPNDSNAIWIDGDYHLLPGSPCIDAGDNNSVPADTTDLDGDGDTIEPVPFDIDGNPRFVDYPNVPDTGNGPPPIVDMGAYEAFVPPIEVPMKFTPQALNPGSKGKWVKAHFVLPEGFAVEDVDTNSPAKITEPFYLESEYINVFINEDDLVEIEAAFGRAEFCGNGPVEGTIKVIGVLTSGQYFYGTDTIKIINNSFEYLAVLASYWLQTDCGAPDWCGGLDVDQDSVVNFVDFAMFDGCCIEFIKE